MEVEVEVEVGVPVEVALIVGHLAETADPWDLGWTVLHRQMVASKDTTSKRV